MRRYRNLFENESKVDIDKVLKSQSLRELITAYRYNGFGSFENFCKAASIDSLVERINIPTIFLNALDDMMSPSKGDRSLLSHGALLTL
jgi:predicted alpha/beta-fold hydrolase